MLLYNVAENKIRSGKLKSLPAPAVNRTTLELPSNHGGDAMVQPYLACRMHYRSVQVNMSHAIVSHSDTACYLQATHKRNADLY